MITIDAGVTEARYYGVGAVHDPEVVVTSDIGSIAVPVASVDGGVIVAFPGDLTRDWPAAEGVATLTVDRDGERVTVGSEDVSVVRTTADQKALVDAVREAVTIQEAYAASTPTPEKAIAHTKVLAAHLAWIGRYILDIEDR